MRGKLHFKAISSVTCFQGPGETALPCAPAVYFSNRGQSWSRHTEPSACVRLSSRGRRERHNLNMQRKALERAVAYYVS